jgi:hypothetical protein
MIEGHSSSTLTISESERYAALPQRFDDEYQSFVRLSPAAQESLYAAMAFIRANLRNWDQNYWALDWDICDFAPVEAQLDPWQTGECKTTMCLAGTIVMVENGLTPRELLFFDGPISDAALDLLELDNNDEILDPDDGSDFFGRAGSRDTFLEKIFETTHMGWDIDETLQLSGRAPNPLDRFRWFAGKITELTGVNFDDLVGG